MISISSPSSKKSSSISAKFLIHEWFSVFIFIGWMTVLVCVTLASRTEEIIPPSLKEQRILAKKIQVSKLNRASPKSARSAKKKSKTPGGV